MKPWLGIAVSGAGLVLMHTASAQQSPAAVSFEQQQAINNKIKRIAPVGLGDRPIQQTPAQLAQRRSWEPTPPPADPRDFSGTWAMINGHLDLIQDDGNQAPFTAAEAESTKRLIAAEESGNVVTDAPSQCFPHGTPRLTITPGYPIRFAYLPGTILMLHEVAHNVRTIHMNQAEPPKGTPRTFLGYSTGRWEGNTLAVTTSLFNKNTRIDSVTSHGPRLKVVERFTKEKTPEGLTNMAVQITINDPDHFYKEFSISRKLGFRSELEKSVGSDGITEYSCEENNRNVPNEQGIVTAK